ncbi:embryonic stem cell-related gene protein-like [Macaca fascicularis]|uniref:embryonic stem cell-related gene protein-like n=1 Tax=Macaca fascicularis TaxID=9541 RepID=UPI0032B041C6
MYPGGKTCTPEDRERGHPDACDIWYQRSESEGLLQETSPLSSPSLCEEIHLRPRVLRPTSPRNISPTSNRMFLA